jgi:succinate dehydrogenase/fumarate reductase flavoprotein subunit
MASTISLHYITAGGLQLPVYSLNTLIVGSGAAALNAALHLHEFGVRNIAIATEQMGGGTSNLSGSDKQTYYKLGLSADHTDSIYDLARTLYDGGAMHGDIALVEAALSVQEFFHLVQLGVPFPHNKYGCYVGYKTDHDPRQRATSAGPRTSQLMFECLAKAVTAKGIPILDHHEVIAILTAQKDTETHAVGAVAVDKTRADSESFGLVLFNCRNIIFATGGPGALYKHSVYPEGQFGSIGIALEAGAVAQNLTESQFGLASTKFRWNVSGSYQQVIPAYFSTDLDGSQPKEFLADHFPSMRRLATCIFLKGYQWPFDARKVAGYGSSLIDLLVYIERVAKGRRTFMDFRRNPSGGGKLSEFHLDDLEPEAHEYLSRSGALLDTPIERLRHMNPLALDLYRSHGIDLEKEPLEVAVCSQHNNGGLKANIWWESNLRHLFPIGEVCGTHGVYRPGGASLNSGQVGGYRAAQYIANRYSQEPRRVEDFLALSLHQVERQIQRCRRACEAVSPSSTEVEDVLSEIQARMSTAAAHIRHPAVVDEALSNALALQKRLDQNGCAPTSREKIVEALRNEHLCLAHVAYLTAVKEYIRRGGGSRGSYLILDPEGKTPAPGLEEWRFKEENPELRREICEVWLRPDRSFAARWVPVRPIPEETDWFETAWADYRAGRIFDLE